ncbi:MAG: tetratricopeptide repeat protein [Candidatus Dormibacteria bacterium]
MDAEFPLALQARASALLDARRPGEAVALLLQLANGDPANAQTLCLLSLAYLQVGQPRDALAAADGAAAASPSAEWPHRLRASALLKLGQGREALAAASVAVALAPNLPECRILLAEAQLANGRLEEARAAAEQARSLAPDRPGGHVMLSMVAAQTGRWREVEHHARAALALDPEDTAALNNLGVALQKLGRRREAVHYLGTASRLDPRNPLYKTNAVKAASRYWGPAVLALLIGVQFLTGDFAVGFALAATGIAGWLLVFLMRGDRRGLWRATWERWTHRGTATADPRASPELMSALRRERRFLDSGERGNRPLRLVLISVVAALALFFGTAFVVQAAVSRRGAGDVALNVVAAALCAAVVFSMFRLALRPGGRRPG